MAKTFDEQKHQDQRLRLLAHARRLFAAKGVKETSMSQIARACKVTKATLYHYFKSKAEVLKEIFTSHEETTGALLNSLKQLRSLEDCLTLVGKRHLEEMEKPEKKEIVKILLGETMHNHEMKKFYIQFINERITQVARDILLPLAPPGKSVKEVNLLVFQYFATLMYYSWRQMIVGDISEWIGDGESFVRRLSKTYAAAFREGG